MVQSIHELKAGTTARVVGYSTDNDFTRRLCEMGFVPGTTFTFVRRALLRGPIEISFGQSRIAMRPLHNVDIQVETLA